MNCDSFQNQMYEYVEGSLSTDAQAAMAQHLGICNGCRQAVEKEKQLAMILSKRLRQNSDALTLSPEIRRAILAAAQRKAASPTVAESVANWWRQWIRVMIPATALLVAMGMVTALHFSSRQVGQTIQVSLTNGVAVKTQSPEQTQPTTVSIQISSQVPTYKFQPEGNTVVDALSTETVMTSGSFQPDATISLPQTQPLKTPL